MRNQVLLYLLKRSSQKRAVELEKCMWLSQALEHSGEAVIIANKRGVIEFVNDAFCEMTGYSVKETLGSNPSMLSSGKQNKVFYKNLWTTILAGETWSGELINKRKDGSLYPSLMTIAPIFNQQGTLTHYVANQRDISIHKGLEKQLFQAQKMEAIGTLAGGIAHDFNNALAAITGNLYLLNKSYHDVDQVKKRSAVIKSVCDSIAIHVKQILSYARSDSVLMNSIELNHCVQSSCQMASSMMPASIELSFISCREELYVHWNESQIQQILINIINNARYALKGIDNPRIILEITIVDHDESIMRDNQTMTDDKYICLSIQDNGCGIPRELIDRIFDPFFTTKEPDEGTGLGLSMAYGAIQQAGGCLSVNSEIDKGTEFRICIPLDFETDIDHMMTVPDKIYEGHGEMILIADDNLQFLQIHTEIVESFGYQVIAAKDGLEAVTLFNQHADEINVVILDVDMPKLTGLKAAQEMMIKKPEVRAILSTGYNQNSSLNGDNYTTIYAPVIHKPFNPAAMSQLIYEQLNKKVLRFGTDHALD